MKFQTQSAIAIATLLLLTACSNSAEKKAFGWCKAAILYTAKNPTAAEVPYRKPSLTNYDGVPTYTFLWPLGEGKLRLQNGYGAMIDKPAECTVKRGAPEFHYLGFGLNTLIDFSRGKNELPFLEREIREGHVKTN